MVEVVAAKSVYYLGTNNEFRSWLFNYDSGIYLDFMGQVKRDTGVKRITDITSKTISNINPVKLGEFILKRFPTCASKELLDRIDWFLDGIGSSDVATIPRRAVLREANKADVLAKLQSENSVCFYTDIGILILVEWLPDKHKNLLDRLPDGAWLHKRLSLDTIVNL